MPISRKLQHSAHSRTSARSAKSNQSLMSAGGMEKWLRERGQRPPSGAGTDGGWRRVESSPSRPTSAHFMLYTSSPATPVSYHSGVDTWGDEDTRHHPPRYSPEGVPLLPPRPGGASHSPKGANIAVTSLGAAHAPPPPRGVPPPQIPAPIGPALRVGRDTGRRAGDMWNRPQRKLGSAVKRQDLPMFKGTSYQPAEGQRDLRVEGRATSPEGSPRQLAEVLSPREYEEQLLRSAVAKYERDIAAQETAEATRLCCRRGTRRRVLAKRRRGSPAQRKRKLEAASAAAAPVPPGGGSPGFMSDEGAPAHEWRAAPASPAAGGPRALQLYPAYESPTAGGPKGAHVSRQAHRLAAATAAAGGRTPPTTAPVSPVRGGLHVRGEGVTPPVSRPQAPVVTVAPNAVAAARMAAAGDVSGDGGGDWWSDGEWEECAEVDGASAAGLFEYDVPEVDVMQREGAAYPPLLPDALPVNDTRARSQSQSANVTCTPTTMHEVFELSPDNSEDGGEDAFDLPDAASVADSTHTDGGGGPAAEGGHIPDDVTTPTRSVEEKAHPPGAAGDGATARARSVSPTRDGGVVLEEVDPDAEEDEEYEEEEEDGSADTTDADASHPGTATSPPQHAAVADARRRLSAMREAAAAAAAAPPPDPAALAALRQTLADAPWPEAYAAPDADSGSDTTPAAAAARPYRWRPAADGAGPVTGSVVHTTPLQWSLSPCKETRYERARRRLEQKRRRLDKRQSEVAEMPSPRVARQPSSTPGNDDRDKQRTAASAQETPAGPTSFWRSPMDTLDTVRPATVQAKSRTASRASPRAAREAAAVMQQALAAAVSPGALLEAMSPMQQEEADDADASGDDNTTGEYDDDDDDDHLATPLPDMRLPPHPHADVATPSLTPRKRAARTLASTSPRHPGGSHDPSAADPTDADPGTPHAPPNSPTERPPANGFWQTFDSDALRAHGGKAARPQDDVSDVGSVSDVSSVPATETLSRSWSRSGTSRREPQLALNLYSLMTAYRRRERKRASSKAPIAASVLLAMFQQPTRTRFMEGPKAYTMAVVDELCRACVDITVAVEACASRGSSGDDGTARAASPPGSRPPSGVPHARARLRSLSPVARPPSAAADAPAARPSSSNRTLQMLPMRPDIQRADYMFSFAYRTRKKDSETGERVTIKPTCRRERVYLIKVVALETLDQLFSKKKRAWRVAKKKKVRPEMIHDELRTVGGDTSYAADDDEAAFKEWEEKHEAMQHKFATTYSKMLAKENWNVAPVSHPRLLAQAKSWRTLMNAAKPLPGSASSSRGALVTKARYTDLVTKIYSVLMPAGVHALHRGLAVLDWEEDARMGYVPPPAVKEHQFATSETIGSPLETPMLDSPLASFGDVRPEALRSPVDVSMASRRLPPLERPGSPAPPLPEGRDVLTLDEWAVALIRLTSCWCRDVEDIHSLMIHLKDRVTSMSQCQVSRPVTAASRTSDVPCEPHEPLDATSVPLSVAVLDLDSDQPVQRPGSGSFGGPESLGGSRRHSPQGRRRSARAELLRRVNVESASTAQRHFEETIIGGVGSSFIYTSVVQKIPGGGGMMQRPVPAPLAQPAAEKATAGDETPAHTPHSTPDAASSSLSPASTTPSEAEGPSVDDTDATAPADTHGDTSDPAPALAAPYTDDRNEAMRLASQKRLRMNRSAQQRRLERIAKARDKSLLISNKHLAIRMGGGLDWISEPERQRELLTTFSGDWRGASKEGDAATGHEDALEMTVSTEETPVPKAQVRVPPSSGGDSLQGREDSDWRLNSSAPSPIMSVSSLMYTSEGGLSTLVFEVNETAPWRKQGVPPTLLRAVATAVLSVAGCVAACAAHVRSAARPRPTKWDRAHKGVGARQGSAGSMASKPSKSPAQKPHDTPPQVVAKVAKGPRRRSLDRRGSAERRHSMERKASAGRRAGSGKLRRNSSASVTKESSAKPTPTTKPTSPTKNPLSPKTVTVPYPQSPHTPHQSHEDAIVAIAEQPTPLELPVSHPSILDHHPPLIGSLEPWTEDKERPKAGGKAKGLKAKQIRIPRAQVSPVYGRDRTHEEVVEQIVEKYVRDDDAPTDTGSPPKEVVEGLTRPNSSASTHLHSLKLSAFPPADSPTIDTRNAGVVAHGPASPWRYHSQGVLDMLGLPPQLQQIPTSPLPLAAPPLRLKKTDTMPLTFTRTRRHRPNYDKAHLESCIDARKRPPPGVESDVSLPPAKVGRAARRSSIDAMLATRAERVKSVLDEVYDEEVVTHRELAMASSRSAFSRFRGATTNFNVLD